MSGQITSRQQMLALQKEFGFDTKIAASLGISQSMVSRKRSQFNVAPKMRRNGKPYFVKRTVRDKNINEVALAQLYAGRRYQDAGG